MTTNSILISIPLSKIFLDIPKTEYIQKLHTNLNQNLPIEHRKQIAQFIREQKVKRTQYTLDSQIEIPSSITPIKIEHKTKEFEELVIREIFTHMQISHNESYTELFKKAVASRDLITTPQQISNSILRRRIYQYKLTMNKQKH